MLFPNQGLCCCLLQESRWSFRAKKLVHETTKVRDLFTSLILTLRATIDTTLHYYHISNSAAHSFDGADLSNERKQKTDGRTTFELPTEVSR